MTNRCANGKRYIHNLGDMDVNLKILERSLVSEYLEKVPDIFEKLKKFGIR